MAERAASSRAGLFPYCGRRARCARQKIGRAEVERQRIVGAPRTRKRQAAWMAIGGLTPTGLEWRKRRGRWHRLPACKSDNLVIIGLQSMIHLAVYVDSACRMSTFSWFVWWRHHGECRSFHSFCILIHYRAALCLRNLLSPPFLLCHVHQSPHPPASQHIAPIMTIMTRMPHCAQSQTAPDIASHPLAFPS
jgi:hypothetical protein